MLLVMCRLANCLAAPLTTLARHHSTHVRGEVALQLCQLADTLPPSLAAARLIGSAHLSVHAALTCITYACTCQPAWHCACKQSAACCLMPQAMLIMPRACCALPWHSHIKFFLRNLGCKPKNLDGWAQLSGCLMIEFLCVQVKGRCPPGCLQSNFR